MGYVQTLLQVYKNYKQSSNTIKTISILETIMKMMSFLMMMLSFRMCRFSQFLIMLMFRFLDLKLCKDFEMPNVSSGHSTHHRELLKMLTL
jgi:hypothetical protein